MMSISKKDVERASAVFDTDEAQKQFGSQGRKLLKDAFRSLAGCVNPKEDTPEIAPENVRFGDVISDGEGRWWCLGPIGADGDIVTVACGDEERLYNLFYGETDFVDGTWTITRPPLREGQVVRCDLDGFVGYALAPARKHGTTRWKLYDRPDPKTALLQREHVSEVNLNPLTLPEEGDDE